MALNNSVLSGKCVHEGDRGRCLCNSGYHGRSCELRSRGFRAGSYMEVHLPPFPKDISLEFKTTLSVGVFFIEILLCREAWLSRK